MEHVYQIPTNLLQLITNAYAILLRFYTYIIMFCQSWLVGNYDHIIPIFMYACPSLGPIGWYQSKKRAQN